jgi:kynureninase
LNASQPTSWKHLFSRALESDPQRLHFAAHSHHPWPNVSRDAQLQAWDEAARFLDAKWDGIFAEQFPGVQGHIARILGLSRPENIALAPNTHEFILRILSCFELERPLRVLTTDSEFHSFGRQAARLEESGKLDVTRIATEPFATFPERFASAARSAQPDLIFVSQVFFNSGYVYREVFDLAAQIDEKVYFVVDGYHGFMARPTDLSGVEDRIFYVAGSYKYAMAGEGVCFLSCPDGYATRPENTGWFASFGALDQAEGGQVPYSPDGFRMAGSTFDPSGLYRFCAVMDMLNSEGLDVATIGAHVRHLQELFLSRIAETPDTGLSHDDLLPRAETAERGRFLTFRMPDAARRCTELASAGVVTDSRADRWRFGFGIYHDQADVEQLVQRLAATFASSGA